MKFQFEQDAVEMIDVEGVDVAFLKDGKEYHTVDMACHSNRPADMHQTYEQRLTCVDDEEFEGMLYFDIVNESCEDEADACNWDKFDVYSH